MAQWAKPEKIPDKTPKNENSNFSVFFDVQMVHLDQKTCFSHYLITALCNSGQIPPFFVDFQKFTVIFGLNNLVFQKFPHFNHMKTQYADKCGCANGYRIAEDTFLQVSRV